MRACASRSWARAASARTSADGWRRRASRSRSWRAGAHLAAIRGQGLRVDSVAGDFAVAPGEASDDPAAIGPVDVVLVGVKAWQVSEAARTLGPLIGPDTFVVPLQNGVDRPPTSWRPWSAGPSACWAASAGS